MNQDAVLISEHATAGGFVIIEATLNSPKSHNALSVGMIHILLSKLPEWDENPEVIALVINGSGDRAFCAGGDIRDLYQAMTKEGVNNKAANKATSVGDNDPQADFGQVFFNLEYSLDMALHKLSIPLLVWGRGYVMGGGMGVFQAANLRIVTPSSRLAMPEITIGLFPDVGASYFLQRVPDGLGLFLGLTAVALNGTDACLLHMADHMLNDQSWPALLDYLQSFSGSGKTEFLVYAQAYINSVEVQGQASNIEPHRQALINAVQQSDLPSIVTTIANLRGQDKWLNKAINTMLRGSPTSLHLTYQQQQHQVSSWYQALCEEYYLAVNSTHLGEFQEGVRALLIDKDQQPNWRYQDLTKVPEEWLAKFVRQDNIKTADFMVQTL